MSRPPANNSAEWIFITVMVLLCGVLTGMQYRWTGELAQAEAGRLGADFADRVQRITLDVDEELNRACERLIPSDRDTRDLGLAKALEAAAKLWAASGPRPVFARVGVAEVREQSLSYHEIDLLSGTLRSTPWPTEWSGMRENLEGKLRGDSPPFNDPLGLVFEVPVFTGGREAGWVIFEIDRIHLDRAYLPELVDRRLGVEGKPLGVIRVRTNDDTVLHQSGTWQDSVPTVREFFRVQGGPGFPSSPRGPGPPSRGGERRGDEGRGPGSGPGPGPDRPDESRRKNRPPRDGAWTLEAQRRPEVLDALVEGSRRRNLGIALALNGLILTAGILLVRHTRQSRRLSQQQMQFVATVSHELRTPLTVIKGAAHNLQRGFVSDPERVSLYLSVITQNTDNLAAMVEQVLAQAGAQRAGTLKQEPVDIAEILRAAVLACEPETQAADCVVEVEIPAPLQPVTGDVSALRRVFQNLIGNAAKHAGSGKWIGVRAKQNGKLLTITVTDRGPGIPVAEQRRIFEPFVRGAVAEEALIRGSGLGLSLVRDLIEAHGGTVTLSSAPGHGCIFTANIPTT